MIGLLLCHPADQIHFANCFAVAVMPPRVKRQRIASTLVAPGQSTDGVFGVAASSMANVGPFQRDVALCVELMFGLRHKSEADVPSAMVVDDPDVGVGAGGLPTLGDDGKYPYPLLRGGTFMEIAQRAFEAESDGSASWLLKESAEMCAAAGLVPSADPVDFHAKFVSAEAT